MNWLNWRPSISDRPTRQEMAREIAEEKWEEHIKTWTYTYWDRFPAWCRIHYLDPESPDAVLAYEANYQSAWEKEFDDFWHTDPEGE